jgi:hypothetical protein
MAAHIPSPKDHGPLRPPEEPSINIPDLLGRLKQPAEPVSREGAGKIVFAGPGERYAFSFRLLARGPETFRLELFDLLGRPVLYLFSLEGKTVLYSAGEKQGRDLPPFTAPFSDLNAIPMKDLPLLLWGRIPLPPYEQFEWRYEADKGNKGIVLTLHGAVQVELRLTPEPFVLSRARFSRSDTKAVEVLFSGFVPFAGGKTPHQAEVQDLERGYVLTVRFDQLVPRNEFPAETFRPPGPE